MRHAHDLLLPEVLDFRSDQGEISLNYGRMLVVGATAVGLLRRELIATVGLATTRRLLNRLGFVNGYQDAINLRARFHWTDPLDGLRMGPTLHALEGAVHAELFRLEYDPATGRFEAEALWRNSFEVEQHLHHCGSAVEPACWSLVGYASGFASACVGGEVYFRESACAAVHGSHCTVVGRDADGWGEDRDEFRRDYRAAELIEECERLHQAARRRHEADARRDRRGAAQSHDLDVLRERVDQYVRGAHMVLASRAMRETMELAARVAPLDTSVLVSGESGTGKEYVVRMIHDQSSRAGRPLVCVNCAALTETLLESELFGHVRGAFTDAIRDKAGLFEIASEGTLFLDEVGEMTPALQAKLLRALQEHEIRRIGSETTLRANPRVVAATNRDLRGAVHAGTFREDLYYRLAAFTIAVPPLRERREAIPVLAQEFVLRAAAHFKKDVQSIAPDAMNVLVDYPWPGNVRELQHAIDRAVILATGPRITTRELPPDLTLQDGGAPLVPDTSFDLHVRERELIEQALVRFGGNRRRAAAALNISTVTLWRRIRRYGVRLPAVTDPDDR